MISPENRKGCIMNKEYYMELMEKTLKAYDIERIDTYYNDVKQNGLKEHGFPRLTANMGILLAHGRRRDLKEHFIRMMDLCCTQIPVVKAANDFSVKELVFCLQELENTSIIGEEKIRQWKEELSSIDPFSCYDIYAKNREDVVHNWAAFTMVSEYMRQAYGLSGSYSSFIDLQAYSQLRHLDENKMYKDPCNPMVYDLVTRGLFAILLDQGYEGKYRKEWEEALEETAWPTLMMQSVSGEIPYGGRSNQFLHNEAHLALLLEYYAKLFAGKGEWKKAALYKAGVKRALENISSWLSKEPILHIKNRFPVNSMYGCENYAYFDKYMITTASFLYVACRICDETIPCGTLDDLTGKSWQSSPDFHKLFLRAGEYFAQYDFDADYHYDCSGMGRLHKKGAPSELCISTPCTDDRCYAVDGDTEKNDPPLAIAPGIFVDNVWQYASQSHVRHIVKSHHASGEEAQADIACIFNEKDTIYCHYLLNKNGLHITMKGRGVVRCLLPAFNFNGEEFTKITQKEDSLEISFRGACCRYIVDSGKICDLKQTARNRNGHYKCYAAEGMEEVKILVTITKNDPATF